MAYSLASYLELSESDAREQWLRVKKRQDRPRQERFLPVEVLLCYALFFVLDPHAFGGGNIDRLPEDVKRLAKTFRRPPGSLTSKMLNLDGSRTNSGQWEPLLFVKLAQNPLHFEELYERTLRAAREVGLGADRIPDILEALQEGRVELLGQDELGSTEIGKALDESKDELRQLSEVLDLREQETTRIVEQRVRLGQHRFAAQVLDDYDHRCGFCGFGPRRLSHHRLLIASHIKPWAKSSNKERLDPRNGIAACPTHDAAFDTGLLTVNGGLRIHRAEPLRDSLSTDEGTVLYFGEQVLRERLILRPDRAGPDPIYLRYHYDEVFLSRLSAG